MLPRKARQAAEGSRGRRVRSFPSRTRTPVPSARARASRQVFSKSPPWVSCATQSAEAARALLAGMRQFVARAAGKAAEPASLTQALRRLRLAIHQATAVTATTAAAPAPTSTGMFAGESPVAVACAGDGFDFGSAEGLGDGEAGA